MTTSDQFLEDNKANYEDLYQNDKLFVQYPMDHVVRFHAYYLQYHMPTGKILDYGCGSGNNSSFYLQRGYDVHGVDVAEGSLEQIKANLNMYGLPPEKIDKFKIIPPDESALPYEDGYFDMILSNQVLYYHATEARIRARCKELARVLRPGGLVFLTMMGAQNYYFTHHTKRIHDKETCEVILEDTSHRLHGLRELLYVVRDEDHLTNLFSEFECINVGFFDMGLFDMKRGFHWIFVGKKAD